MGASFDEVKLQWRRKGQRIGNMTPDEIKKSLNKRFFAIKQDLEHEYGHGGYTGTLAEKGGVVINYFPFLTDKELETLVGWITSFNKKIMGDFYFISNYTKEHNEKQNAYGEIDGGDLKSALNWGWYILDQRFVRDRYGNYPKRSRWGSDRPLLNKWQIDEYRNAIVKAFNKWQKKLGKRDKEILKKLRENDFSLTKQGYYLVLMANDKGEPAVGMANNNDVYYFGMCSS